MLNTAAQFRSMEKDLLGAVRRVLSSGEWINGSEVRLLEEEIASLAGCRHAVALASGTDALLLSLKALGVGPGDDVVVPTFTFFATAGVVVNAGARPVFADVLPDTLNLDPVSFDRVATGRTKVVIPVDLFGLCADYGSIHEIARSRGIHILEDAAQAIGARYRERPAGSLGKLAAFSFYPTKNLGACGDAGAATTDDEDLSRAVRRLAAHGSDGGSYVHAVVGTNSRCDALQAAILRIKRSRLAGWQGARDRNAASYRALLSGVEAIALPAEPTEGSRHVHHQFVIRVRRGSRDALRSFLLERGIDTGIYYPIPLHLQDCFASLGGRPGDFPIAEKAAREVLALPVHPDLTEQDVARVAADVVAWTARLP
jgi:dTDP-4-amino-4,6-dideoxygalactose transaminase